MDFTPSHRLRSRLIAGPSQDSLASTLPIPVFVQLRQRKERQFARCSFSGFYEPETLGNRRYIWTQETALVTCHFVEPTRLRYVWLEVDSTAPCGGTVQLWIDDMPISAVRRIRGRSTVCGRLSAVQLFHELTLKIQASTFVPSQTGLADDDARQLGIAVRGIIFGKRRSRYRPQSLFARPLHHRVTSAVHQIIRKRSAA